MSRDPTVWLSLLMMVVPLAIWLQTGMPETIDGESPPLLRLLFWTAFVGALRASMLWLQTLVHGVRYAREENRVAVVIAHLFLGILMAYLYYLSSRMDAAQARRKAASSIAEQGPQDHTG